jgi:NAD-dependent deacetylase
MDNSQVVLAAQILAAARSIVCLTGAGVSAESGIETFRDTLTGLWSRFDPRQLASQEGFAENPGLVWQWYMARLAMVEQAQPNAGHIALAQLEQLAPAFTLFTQNVDDLHERAGSRNVFHLHGVINRFCCNLCGDAYALQDADRESAIPPSCGICSGAIRPMVVWFGEMLPVGVLEQAWRAVDRCDVMLVAGTSGVVYPAAQLPHRAIQQGATVIDINPEYTEISAIATLFLQGSSGQVLPQIVSQMTRGRNG